MSKWDRNDYVIAWREEDERFRRAAASADFTRPIPSCPDWTVADLVRHLAVVYGRIAQRVLTAQAPESGPGSPSPPEVPHETESRREELLVELDDAAAELRTVLERVDLDDPAWNWAPAPNLAGFWHRRAAAETAVHRWDLQIATGPAEPLAPALAAESIEEALEALLPAGRRASPEPTFGLIELHAVDLDRRWYVRLRGERVSILDAPSVDSEQMAIQAAVSGTASDLLLALWNRVPFDALDRSGDPDLPAGLRVA